MLKGIKVTLALVLMLCLLEMTYGYYQFVRFVGMVAFAYLGMRDEARQEVKYFWFVSAILINPIIKIPLDRDLWNIVDVIWAVILLWSAFAERFFNPKS
mgnify:CR=1 FL=1